MPTLGLNIYFFILLSQPSISSVFDMVLYGGRQCKFVWPRFMAQKMDPNDFGSLPVVFLSTTCYFCFWCDCLIVIDAKFASHIHVPVNMDSTHLGEPTDFSSSAIERSTRV